MENKMKAKIDFNVLKRVMKYLTKSYKLRIFFVIICLLVSTASSVAGNLYLQTLIDDYIVPLVGTQNPVYTSLIKAIMTMIFIYGIRCSIWIFIKQANG